MTQGKAVEKGDDLLAVNGIPIQCESGTRRISVFAEGARVAGSGWEEGDGMEAAAAAAAAAAVGGGGGDRSSMGKFTAAADADGVLILRVLRGGDARCEQEVVCSLHKTLLELASDDIEAAIEEAKINKSAETHFLGSSVKVMSES